jgi:hypothetical protein
MPNPPVECGGNSVQAGACKGKNVTPPAAHLKLLMVADRPAIRPALEQLAAVYGDRFSLWGE